MSIVIVLHCFKCDLFQRELVHKSFALHQSKGVELENKYGSSVELGTIGAKTFVKRE
jgi:hypothetical protein